MCVCVCVGGMCTPVIKMILHKRWIKPVSHHQKMPQCTNYDKNAKLCNNYLACGQGCPTIGWSKNAGVLNTAYWTWCFGFIQLRQCAKEQYVNTEMCKIGAQTFVCSSARSGIGISNNIFKIISPNTSTMVKIANLHWYVWKHQQQKH